MKPTLGPWIFNPQRGDIIAPNVKKEDSRLGRGDDRDEVWNYYGGEVVAETVAGCDGPLLSASLDLLEAAERICASSTRDEDGQTVTIKVWLPAFKALEAAIAKAKTQPPTDGKT